jgi:transglutaminase-like putative cysteine protease
VASALAVLTAGIAVTEAARLPEWAQPIAAAPPPIEPGISRHDGRVLFRERRIEVQPDGTWIERVRVARQALTTRAGSVAIDYFPFNDRARMRVSRAWHQPPGERAERSGRSSQIDIVADDAFITDARRRVVGMDDVRPGSLVFFEFEAAVEPYTLATEEIFADRGPIAVARFEIVTPPGWTLRSEWLHRAAVEPTQSGTTTTWEVRDLPDDDDPPLAPSPLETAPWLVVAFEPPAGTPTRAAPASDWPALVEWFLKLAAGTEVVTPEIRAAAERATAGAATVPERIHAVARYVRDSVRYTARLVGIGGYRPESAAETLRTLHGECKAKATLARALLAAVDIPSYPVMVNLTHQATVPEGIALLGAFDHMIVAVPIAALDEGPFGPAVADGGELGSLAIVDATDEYTSLGWVSEGLSGKRALVAAPGRGRIVTLPGRRPQDHRVERRITADLRPGNTVALEMTTRTYGAPAAFERQRERTSAVDRRREQEHALHEEWLDAKPVRYGVELEAADGAFIETIAWTMPVVQTGGSPPHIPLFAGADAGLPRPQLGKRTVPVSFPYPRQLSTEVTLRGFPESAAPSAPKAAAAEGWSSTVLSWPEAGGLHVRWTLVLERTDYPVERFGDLKKLYGATAAALSAIVSWGP